MSLARLPDAAWEVLLAYLQLRHLARLCLTGNALLTSAVLRAHRETSFAALFDCRSTVLDVLMPSTVRLTASERQALHLFAMPTAATSRVRVLNIVRVGDIRASAVGMSLADAIDLTGLSRLETLRLSGDVLEGIDALVLPSSLVVLSLGRCGDSTQAMLAQLVKLEQLDVTLSALQLQRFEHDAQWPPNLTALKLSTYSECSDADASAFGEALRLLPRSLLHLVLADVRQFVHGVLDIFPPAVCDRLVSYEVQGPCACSDRAAFPASLKRLVVEQLPPVTHAMLGALLSSSLTHFSFFRYQMPSMLGELAATIPHLLPRMDRHGVTCLVGHAMRWCRGDIGGRRWPPSRLETICVEALTRVGLHAPFFRFMKFVNYSESPNASDLLALKSVSLSSVIDRDMRSQVVDRARFYPFLFQWAVELGLFTTIDVRDLHLLDNTALHRNLTTLTVVSMESTTRSIGEVLGAYDFSCVRKIEVWSGDWLEFVAALHRNRDRFASLDEIACKTANITPESDMTALLLLAQMRIYPCKRRRTFLYRVSPPVGWCE